MTAGCAGARRMQKDPPQKGRVLFAYLNTEVS